MSLAPQDAFSFCQEALWVIGEEDERLAGDPEMWVLVPLWPLTPAVEAAWSPDLTGAPRVPS